MEMLRCCRLTALQLQHDGGDIGPTRGRARSRSPLGPSMKAPRSKLRGIKTQNLQPSKQLHLDVLTMQLLIRLFAALLLDILAYDFFIAMTPYGTDKVTFGPEFSAP